jgi:hypothetical protein
MRGEQSQVWNVKSRVALETSILRKSTIDRFNVSEFFDLVGEAGCLPMAM